ncbi:MAG: O-antigen ligase family protein, partial [Halobacteriales archaeon]|nr:O-antigen ligase family protein [Halobacteriales archaeon]
MTATLRARLGSALASDGALLVGPLLLWLVVWAGQGTGVGRLQDLDAVRAMATSRSILAPLAAVGALLLLRATLRQRSPDAPPLRRAAAPALLLLAYAAVGVVSSLIASPAPAGAVYWVVVYAAVPLVVLVAAAQPNGAQRVALLVRANWAIIAVIAVALMLFALWRLDVIPKLLHGDIPRPYGNYGYVDEYETPFAINANGAGRFAAVAALVGISRVVGRGAAGKAERAAWAVVLPLAMFLLVVTQSRSALTGFAAAALLVVALHRGVKPLGLLLGAGVLGLALTGHLGDFLGYLTRNETEENIVSLSGRTLEWGYALDLLRGSPLLGFGFQADRYILGQHMHDAWIHA